MSDVPAKPVAASASFLCDVVGEESLAGRRMQAGVMFSLVDQCAGVVASKHVGGRVTTVAFDRMDLLKPILHHECVRVEGQVIEVGRSSVVVLLRASKLVVATREFELCQVAIVTMVALDNQMRPHERVPALVLETEKERALSAWWRQRKALSERWAVAQRESDTVCQLTAAMVEDPINRVGRDEFISIAQTLHVMRIVFQTRNLNLNKTIFGGDILNAMDRAAGSCASRFLKSRECVCISSERIHFAQPVFVTDMVELQTRVVYVRASTLDIEVTVVVERPGQREPMFVNTGFFTFISFAGGAKAPIRVALDLRDAPEDDLRRYWKARMGRHAPVLCLTLFAQARRRYEFWLANRDAFRAPAALADTRPRSHL